MRFSDDQLMKFIQLYEEHKCLWMYGAPSYKNKAMRISALEKIVKEMALPKLDIAECKNKIKNIRSQYCQELKKIGDSKRSGADTLYKPTLTWFDQVDGFLKKYVQHRTHSNLEVTGGESHAEDNLDLAFDMEGDGTQHSVDSQKSTNIRENSSPVDPIAIKRPRKQITDVDEECETFGRHVAVQLKQLPTTQRILAQDELQKVLTRYRLAAINGGPAASPQPSASDNYYSDPLTIVKEEVDET
ncbi:uncharacterized protein [Macrobrachium rosenbergii]|uniref:uncharacterized protein isoform X4 n=1 Tax=Macrobrachium rosenbergii TaxID=79674 RepID=UPI0034D6043E